MCPRSQMSTIYIEYVVRFDLFRLWANKYERDRGMGKGDLILNININSKYLNNFKSFVRQ